MARVRMFRRWLVASAAAAALVVPGAPSAGATELRTIRVGTVTEAWYHTTVLNSGPLCESPAGCGLPVTLPPVSPFPEGTLHAGVALGQETSRAYITLATDRIPKGGALTGGVLRLPVAGEDAGTVAADTATLVACFVPAGLDPPGPDDPRPEGAFDIPPEVDCETRSPALFVPAAGDTGPLFTISLAPFASAFTTLPEGALALMPDPDLTAPPNPETPGPPNPALWHVATNGKDVQAEGARRIEAELQVTIPTDDDDAGGGFDPVPYVPPYVPPAPDPTFAAPTTPATTAVPTTPTTPPFSLSESEDSPYAYPVVWLVPVGLLLLGSLLGRSFTRPVSPAASRRTGPPSSV